MSKSSHSFLFTVPMKGCKTSTSLEASSGKRAGEEPSAGVLPFLFLLRSRLGEKSCIQTGRQPAICPSLCLQIPAVYNLKVKHRFNWYGGLWNNLSSLNLTNFFYQPGWRITPSRCLMLTATQTNLFSCAKRSIIWNMIVFGHFSIFLVKSWWSIKSTCAVSCVHRCVQPPIPMVPLWGQPSNKIRAEFFSTTYKAIF